MARCLMKKKKKNSWAQIEEDKIIKRSVEACLSQCIKDKTTIQNDSKKKMSLNWLIFFLQPF